MKKLLGGIAHADIRNQDVSYKLFDNQRTKINKISRSKNYKSIYKDKSKLSYSEPMLFINKV